MTHRGPGTPTARRLHQDLLLRIFEDLAALGRSAEMRLEKRRLWDEEHEGGRVPADPSFWPQVEWTEERFIGYCHQLAKKGALKQDAAAALASIRAARFMSEAPFAGFLALQADAYPLVCRYLGQLDYLRLLTAEHIEAFLLAEGA